ncbi:MAG: fatty acid desaturase family protein [Gammaproteobacteria bacterium]|nr:fatty acid desaturase family protein [Gammaproteobacteria bacterium]
MDFERSRYHFDDKISKELAVLYKLDNWHGLIAITIDYLVIATAVGSAIYIHWLYPVAWLIIGSRQRALATILHESVHYSLAKNKTLNYVLGTFFSGYLIFQSFSLYSVSHIKKHHAYLGDKELDPDYKYHLNLNLYQSTNKKLYSNNFRAVFFTYFSYLLKNRMGIFVSKNKDAVIGRYYLMMLFISFFYFGYLKYAVIFWFVPMISSFLMIGWFLELSEHYPMVHYNNVDLYMTRNRFSHWIEAFFFSIHNENYHLIHHLKPRLPFWNMRKAHQILMQDTNYRKINQTMGGVLISSNKSAPVISLFTRAFSIKLKSKKLEA